MTAWLGGRAFTVAEVVVTGTAALVARVVGWAFAIWGTALYWWAGVLYLTQVRQIVRSDAGGERR